MKNRLTDLNNHLFAQIERLSEEGMTAEQIDIEVKRAQAVVSVSDQIVGVADTTLKAVKLVVENGSWVEKRLPMLAQPDNDAPKIEGTGR